MRIACRTAAHFLRDFGVFGLGMAFAIEPRRCRVVPSFAMNKPASKPIIAAIDGSSHSRKVAVYANRLARAFDTGLTLLHVVGPLPEHMAVSLGLLEGQWLQSQLREGQSALDELCSELGLLEVETMLLAGPVPETICGEAEEADAEMIVIGAHGHGPSPRIMLGSVGDRVASLSSRSVTIVR